MNKFVNTISADNDSIKKERAVSLSSRLKTEMTDLINGITKRKNELEGEIMDITDVGSEDSTSLRPGGKNFDTKGWVEGLFNAKVSLALVETELKIAK